MNWSYIAGFFDGEGSITHNGNGYRISIPQTNEEVLLQIKDFTKLGSIIKVTKRKIHWKDSWTYYIAKKQDVHTFLKNVIPYLIVKKNLSLKAMPYLEQELLNMKEKERIYKKRKAQAKLLRLSGWNYRKIGKELNVDWGYARRLILDLA